MTRIAKMIMVLVGGVAYPVYASDNIDESHSTNSSSYSIPNSYSLISSPSPFTQNEDLPSDDREDYSPKMKHKLSNCKGCGIQ